MGKFVDFSCVDLNDGFWQDRYNLNKNTTIPAVRDRFEETARFDAMRFNFIKNGKKVHFYYDSDVAKWVEAVAYIIKKDRSSMEENEKLIDDMVEDMARAQRDDGYINSYHQQFEPSQIFKNRDHHELYCCGHFIEAAIAYHEATGKRKLLDIMERYCACIEKAFIIDKTAGFVTPGHEEIELALYKLYRYTGNAKYKSMAEFFLVNRGKTGEVAIGVPLYAQDEDIYTIKEAQGHSVRALYLYSAIADMAKENDDNKLKEVLRGLWRDMVDKKMYITGGFGSTPSNEGFTVEYDLPNLKAYAESCCAIAMFNFALRMRALEKNAEYGDIIERVMYNSLLSSTSLDGKSFFYVNPLEIALEEVDRERSSRVEAREHLPIRQRLEVFGCSCCPPNINRKMADFASAICYEDEIAYIEQYIPSVVNGRFGAIFISGEYAIDGKVCVSSRNYKANEIAFRAPAWSEKIEVKVNGRKFDAKVENGYIHIPVSVDFTVELDFNIKPVFVASNPKVRANAGRVALTYGPVVYCIEGVDNGERLNRIFVDIRPKKVNTYKDFHGLLSIEMAGKRDKDISALYVKADQITQEDITLKFIPYFAFANRGETSMLVFIRKA